MKKSLQSANFKKDYVAYSAVVIFFIIISFELFMAVFIPAHLQMEDVWSEEVARQEMLNRFDYTRNIFSGFRSKRDYTRAEAEIISNSFTPLAEYLRQHQYQIGLKETKEINKAIKGFPVFHNNLSKKGAHSTERKLKNKKIIDILKKEMIKIN